jgi:hypothetical protein
MARKPLVRVRGVIAVDGDDEQDDDNDLRSFTLVFEGATCDDCGDTVPVTRACSCGAWEPRDDEHVQLRRAVIADIRASIAAPIPPSTPIEFSEVIDGLSEWIPTFFDGLTDLGTNDPDAALAEKQVRGLVGLRARVAAVPRRRPWLAIWDPITAMIDALLLMAGAELDAATAPDPDGAKVIETIGQGLLDEAAAKIRAVSDRLDWWGLDTTIRLPDSLIAAAEAAYESTGAQNLLDLDSRGMERYQRITGKPVGPSGVGVGLLLDLGLADRAFDEERVYRVARAVYERIDGKRPGFLALLDDPEWRADLLNARRVFYEAQLTAETLLRELAGERRLEAGAVLYLGAKLTERVSSAIVGLVVASDPKLRQKRTADYTAIHAAARKLGLGDLLHGFDARIRNADAHTTFDVGDDHVILDRNRRAKPELVSDEDLVDIVLASVESCAAIFGGIDCLLIESGHPAATDRSEDIPVEDYLKILLAASGVQVSRIEIHGHRLEVSGAAMGQLSVNPLSVIASLAPIIPVAVRRVTFRVKGADGTTAADAAIDPLRRAQAGTGLAKDAAYLEFFARARLNGREVMGRKHLRFLAARHFVPLINAPLSDFEPAVELLAATARRLKDRELAEAFDAALVMRRAQEGGPPAPARARANYERLVSYASTPPGPWNPGSGSSGGLAAA